MMWGYNGFGGGGMGIGMLLFWGLIVALVLVLVRALGSRSGDERHRTPLDILRERYAKGEIDKAEFEQKRRELSTG
jgi:putative membrane protein